MLSLKYLGEAVFFLAAALRIAKWTTRTAREVIPPSDAGSSTELELPHMLPALVARGVAPADEIARLAPHERVAMYHAVFDGEEGGVGRMADTATGWGAACPRCGAPLGAGTVPVGYLTHCPGCGAELRAR